MNRFIRLAAGLLSAAALVGCHDFLTRGEVANDPNRPAAATALQLFVGVQSNIWSQQLSDPSRLAGVFVQQLIGTNGQYQALQESNTVTEAVTGGFYAGLYGGGGLIDIRRIETQSAAAGDSTFLGIALVQEALLIGTGADLFGDIVYSQAYKGPNPALDPQLAVYDSVQTVLDRAITVLAAGGPTNIGPGSADLAYGGDPTKWSLLAHTLKARFYLHTAEVRPAAYAQALAESKLGLTDDADNFTAQFADAANEQSFLYQFDVVQRSGYLVPGDYFVTQLQSSSDLRLARYFNKGLTDFSDTLLDPAAKVPIVTADENLLIEAETANRAGDDATARAALNTEQTQQGVTPTPGSVAGPALLKAILDEKYIALFGEIEPFNDYKRTCYPNLAPVSSTGKKIPARLFYDTSERQTNTNIPQPQNQPTRNANDPANATDPFGNACLGQ